MAAVQSRGTVLPAPNFHAERAAIKLQKAIKGIGTDEKVIIEVLTSHSNSQRQEIKKKYKSLYGRDLTEDLQSDLSGHFEDVCIALLIPNEEYLVECLSKAIKGIGTDELCLLDILAIQKQNEIETLSNMYKEKYGDNLEIELKDELSHIFKTLIRSLMSGGREESPTEDDDKVNTDVSELRKAANEADAETVAAILNIRSYDHLKQVFDAYLKLENKDIESEVKNLFTGDAEVGYLTLVRIIKGEAEYFAERIFSCLDGIGTDDATLIRLLVTHSETDLGDIKERFKALCKKEISDAVSEDTSGDYRKILVKLLS